MCCKKYNVFNAAQNRIENQQDTRNSISLEFESLELSFSQFCFLLQISMNVPIFFRLFCETAIACYDFFSRLSARNWHAGSQIWSSCACPTFDRCTTNSRVCSAGHHAQDQISDNPKKVWQLNFLLVVPNLILFCYLAHCWCSVNLIHAIHRMETEKRTSDMNCSIPFVHLLKDSLITHSTEKTICCITDWHKFLFFLYRRGTGRGHKRIICIVNMRKET